MSDLVFILPLNESFIGIVNLFVNNSSSQLPVFVLNKFWNKSRMNLGDVTCRFLEKMALSEITLEERPGGSVERSPQRARVTVHSLLGCLELITLVV